MHLRMEPGGPTGFPGILIHQMKTTSLTGNSGGEVLRRVEHGERIVATRDGASVAELRPGSTTDATTGSSDDAVAQVGDARGFEHPD
jgi:hypothetical protein